MRYLALVALVACGGGKAKPDIDANSAKDAAVIDAPPDAPVPTDAAVAACAPAPGTDLALEQVASGLDSPVLLTAPPGDARLFVLEQPGRIRIVDSGELLGVPFLDITDVVNDTPNEAGLLGLAFHPQWPATPLFYVNYTAGSLETVIAEYRVSADPDVADRDSERRLLTIDQPAGNHDGGMIAFGPDGFLYIGMGDGGGSNDTYGNGQNLDTLLGAMLRIDVNGAPYGIPADNPYAAPGGERDEILHYGLRNPWRWSFDRATGDLYLADVGQGAWEEIDVVPAGATAPINFGWPIWEGAHCRAGGCGDMSPFAFPAHEYAHASSRCSVTGGFVYRGACLPDLAGTYFYGDYCTGEIFSFVYAGGEATQHTDWTAQLNPGPRDRLTSFGQDGTGELYVLFRDGTVHRIVAR